MAAVVAMRVALQTDLAGFVALLQRFHVPHRVSEESGEQVLWVPNDSIAEKVRELYEQYPHGDGQAPLPAPKTAKLSVVRQLRQSPATTALLVLTLIVFTLTMGGENLTHVGWLSFVELYQQGSGFYLSNLQNTLEAGQWWRLITPIFVHFGLLHLAMNSLWLWELGRRIEWLQGAVTLLLLVAFFGVVSNFAQYWWSGPSLFGGLSGVLYGLLGHCWMYQKLASNPVYRLPPGVLVLMLVWLVVCMTGVLELLQMASIANAAHLGGLVAGCVTGLLSGALARRAR